LLRLGLNFLLATACGRIYPVRMRQVQDNQAEVAMESAGTAVADVGALSTDWRAWLERARHEVENALTIHLKELESAIGPHGRLAEAVQYSVRAGGKRIRPILVLETCRVGAGTARARLPGPRPEYPPP